MVVELYEEEVYGEEFVSWPDREGSGMLQSMDIWKRVVIIDTAVLARVAEWGRRTSWERTARVRK